MTHRLDWSLIPLFDFVAVISEMNSLGEITDDRIRFSGMDEESLERRNLMNTTTGNAIVVYL